MGGFLLGEVFLPVRFGRSLPAPRVHVVTSDQVANGLIAYDAIIARGYQRIGLVSEQIRCTEPPKGQKSDHDRRWLVEAGFLMAQAETDAERRVPVLFLDRHNQAKNQVDLQLWLKRHKPDAVISDHAELPALLRKADCRIPEDIGFAAVSVLDGNGDAGIYQNPEEVGRVAVLVLTSLLNDNALSGRTAHFSPNFSGR